MKAQDLIFTAIYPACKQLDSYSPAAIALIAGTASVESNVAEYLVQTTFRYGSDLSSFNGGLGPFQQQIDDHDDIVKNFLPGNLKIATRAHEWLGLFDAKRLATDLVYAAMFCRIHYLRINHPLPDWEDVEGLANYWKTHYNSSLGAGTESHFVDSYSKVKDAVAHLVAFVG